MIIPISVVSYLYDQSGQFLPCITDELQRLQKALADSVDPA